MGKKGWRVYNIDTGAISFSRDVVFNESVFPFATITPSSSSEIPPLLQLSNFDDAFDVSQEHVNSSSPLTDIVDSPSNTTSLLENMTVM